MLPQGQNNVNSIQCRLSAVYMRSVLENINDRKDLFCSLKSLHSYRILNSDSYFSQSQRQVFQSC